MDALAPGSARGHDRSRAPRRSGRALPAHLRGKVNETEVRALVADDGAWAAVALVTAGGFVAQNVGHLKERNLSTLIPPILVCFAAWGARRLWSFRGTTVACACFVGLVVAVLPDRVFDSAGSTFDAPSLVGMHLLSEHVSGLAFRAALVAAIAACLLGSWWIARSTWARRAWLPGLLILPLALLTPMSLVASREIRIAADRDRQFFLGSGSSGLDRPPHREPDPPRGRRLVLLERLLAPGVLESTRRRRARALSGHRRPLPGRIDARVYEDGSIRNQLGQPVRSPGLVTSNAISVAGTARARLARRAGPAGSFSGMRTSRFGSGTASGERARANVGRALRDRGLRLPPERPARVAPWVRGDRGPVHGRRRAEGERGRQPAMDTDLGRVAPSTGRQAVCGALRA